MCTVEPQRPRRPGRPATLSADAIVDAALALVDETGALRLADLGARLGVDTSAMYRYFRNRGALVSAVADRFLAPLRQVPPTTMSWRVDFENRLRRLESLYRTHPARAMLVLTEAELGGSALEEIALGAQILRRSGAPERDVFTTLHAIEVAVYGSITYDSIGGADADAVRRQYHRLVGEFDVDSMFPTAKDLAAESSATMWLLVGAALDRLELTATC